MEINYDKIDKELNSFAIDKIYDLLSNFDHEIMNDAKRQFENSIINNKIIVVNKPSQKDINIFKENIPSAHGPRAKKDGTIHIYPYIYNKDTEWIIKHYINEGILTHELCHYIIKLDFESLDESEEKLGHFINEGAVQLLTELIDKKKYQGVEYRKNVELVEILLTKIPFEKIFAGNLKEILSSEQFEEIKEEYFKLSAFIKEINNFVTKIGTIYGMDYKSIIRRLKMKTTLETINYLKEELQKLPNSLEKENLIEEFDEILNKFNKEKEVTPKM